jgi:hypothetical protein
LSLLQTLCYCFKKQTAQLCLLRQLLPAQPGKARRRVGWVYVSSNITKERY